MNSEIICNAFSKGNIILSGDTLRIIYSNGEFISQYFKDEGLQVFYKLLEFDFGISANQSSVELIFKLPQCNTDESNVALVIPAREYEYVPPLHFDSGNCISLGKYKLERDFSQSNYESLYKLLDKPLFDEPILPTFSEMRRWRGMDSIRNRLSKRGIVCELAEQSPEDHEPGYLEVDSPCIDGDIWFDDKLICDIRALSKLSTSIEIEFSCKDKFMKIIFYI